MFIYDHKDSTKVFDLLYKNVKNRLFLERKYNVFLEGMKRRLEQGELGGERIRRVV